MLKANEGNYIIPEISGMCIFDFQKGALIQPLKGITTAQNIFDEINIKVIKPKPKIFKRKDILNLYKTSWL